MTKKSNIDISTSSLLNRLFKTSSIDRFIKRYNAKSIGTTDFHVHISNLCAEKGISQADVLLNADIELDYGRQLFKGIRKPSRDKVIQLAFGFAFDYEETQKLLVLARKSALYPKIERDAVIIYALQHGYKIYSVQDTLFELGIPILGEER